MQPAGNDVFRSDIVMVGHHQMWQEGLGVQRRPLDDASLELSELPPNSVRPQCAENVELSLPGVFCSPIGEIDDDTLFDPVDGRMWLIDEALQAF
jgi:hypothetical protein